VRFGIRVARGDEGHTDQSVRIYKEKKKKRELKGLNSLRSYVWRREKE
jgi:hypothetical protein